MPEVIKLITDFTIPFTVKVTEHGKGFLRDFVESQPFGSLKF